MFTVIMSLALAGEVTTAAPEKQPVADDKIVCRSEVTVGSRIPTRVCRTQKQWAKIHKSNKEELENRSSYSRGTQNRN